MRFCEGDDGVSRRWGDGATYSGMSPSPYGFLPSKRLLGYPEPNLEIKRKKQRKPSILVWSLLITAIIYFGKATW